MASWRAFHRMRNIPEPFAGPLIAQARQKARRVAARVPSPKSAHPITRPVLAQILANCNNDLRGIRDRAMFTLAFASGGRRRSEVTGLNIEDIRAPGLTREAPAVAATVGNQDHQQVRGAATSAERPGGARPGALAGGEQHQRMAIVPCHLEILPRPLPRRLAPEALRQILR